MAQTEEGGGVLDGVVGVEGLDHRLVAGGLNVPAEQPVGQPQQGVAPVQAQSHPGQGLGPVIPPADVGLLVEEDVLPVAGSHAGGGDRSGAGKSRRRRGRQSGHSHRCCPADGPLRPASAGGGGRRPRPKGASPGPKKPRAAARSGQERAGIPLGEWRRKGAPALWRGAPSTGLNPGWGPVPQGPPPWPGGSQDRFPGRWGRG